MGAKNIKWEKDSIFNKWCWENQISTLQKNEIRPLSYTTHKTDLKWIQV